MSETPTSEIQFTPYENLQDYYQTMSKHYADAQVAQKLLKDLEMNGLNGIGGQMDGGSFPWNGPGSFGKNGKKTYYYQNEPTQQEYAYTARHFPMGKRLTYGRAEDDWQNNFVLNFPKNKFDQVKTDEINYKITKHNKDIKLYTQGKRATALDYVQGEALLMKFRQGDGILSLTDLMHAQLDQFNKPEDPTKPILFVLAIDKIDYQPIGSEKSNYFRWNLNFFKDNDVASGFIVHPSRVIRWRSEQWDYEQNSGFSKLIACFGQLTILQQICFSMGNAIERYGHGFPLILLKNAQSKAQLQRAAALIGDVSARSWLMAPKEMIDSFEFKGVAGTAMNFQEAIDATVDQIVSVSQIPYDVLMGKAPPVSQSGEVFDRGYFGTLDKDHSSINPYIEEIIDSDPFYKALFKEEGIDYYTINWGLKQVMTEKEQSELEMRLYTNIMSMTGFAFTIECRRKAKLQSVQEVFAEVPDGEKICMDLYGMTPKMFDYTMLSAGSFRQQLFLEQTDPKQEAAVRNEQTLVENNNPENKARHEGTSTTSNAGSGAGKLSEAKRRESKVERGAADEELISVREELERIKIAMNEQINFEKDIIAIIKDLRKTKDEQGRELSTYKLAEKMGMNRSTLTDVLSKAELLDK